jgi:hypothetical protein
MNPDNGLAFEGRWTLSSTLCRLILQNATLGKFRKRHETTDITQRTERKVGAVSRGIERESWSPKPFLLNEGVYGIGLERVLLGRERESEFVLVHKSLVLEHDEAMR